MREDEVQEGDEKESEQWNSQLLLEDVLSLFPSATYSLVALSYFPPFHCNKLRGLNKLFSP